MKKFIQACLLVLCGLGLTTASAQSNLADRHVAKQMNCSVCHKSDDKKAITQEVCVMCHGDQKAMQAKTNGKFGEVNPHFNHQPKPQPCIKCHKGHKAQQIYCNKCHEFEFHKK